AVATLTPVISGCNDNAPSVTTSALTLNVAPGAVYYIRVGSKGGSLSSLTFNATAVSVAGSAPTRNYFTTATPTLTWNRVTNATQYIVQVSKQPGFGSFAFAPVTVPSSQLSIDTPALSEGIYYWRVSANNGVTWSVADPFTIDLP
nr:hypothetical protein [Anaerolineae bacterium]